MKKMKLFLLLGLGFMTSVQSLSAQEPASEDSTGLPGDQFSLQGAVDMFKKSASPEEFEKLINTADNHVNNLDLNGDGETDYVRVIGKMEKDMHAFILQVPVSESENQDIAVIEIEKTGDEEAMLQIIGDEDIYGEQVIVEPSDGTDGDDDGGAMGHGPSFIGYKEYKPIVVNVWGWPSVRFIYRPAYTVWVSPFRWRMYPAWWKPWRPFAWHVWHPFRRVHFHPGIRVVHTHRVVRCHAIYRPVRVTSVSVRTRHSTAVGNYRVTRTRTTVTGPRGNGAVKKTTTIRGPGGKVKAQKTTVRRKRG